MTRLLVPGLTCGSLHAGAESGVLVDGRDVYRAVYAACAQARRTILISGWQFEHHVALLRGDDAAGARHPTRLLPFLRDLCERTPELEVYLLAWDASAVFAFERVPLQWLLFRAFGHPRIHYRMDSSHPVGASHHQKFVVVDRGIALLGGMDICNSRWDRRMHAAHDPLRRNRWRTYPPYHDVHAYVTGEAVDVLRDWFRERWELATDRALHLPDVPRRPIAIEPTAEIAAPSIGLARTRACTDVPPVRPIDELYQLHLRAIGTAEQLIYVENQYLSSDEIGRAIERRLQRGPRLEIVIVLPCRSKSFKERMSMGIHQAMILERLGAAAARHGHGLGVYCGVVADAGGEVPVFVHSKVLAVDDRFLLVSSANTSNRSMGFDSELGIAWEAPEPAASIRAVRVELLAEHCGLSRGEATERLGPIPGLVARLDHLADARTHRLRRHRRNVDERPGRVLGRLLSERTPFDPRDPRSFHEALPEPAAFLDRFVREPIAIVAQHVRHWFHRRRRLGP